MPKRKSLRLKTFDYSSNGAYYVTVCVEGKRQLLGEVVGDDAHIIPICRLSQYGCVVRKYIENINLVYSGVWVDKYIVMPNHIHLILFVDQVKTGDGPLRAAAPTSAIIPTVVRSLKTMVTKEVGISLWQRSYHDHIIRDENEYQEIWQYIDQNPAKWADDEYYNQQKGGAI